MLVDNGSFFLGKSYQIYTKYMDVEKINGQWVYLVAAKWFNEGAGQVDDVQFGLLASDLQLIASRGFGTSIAQFERMVAPGLILSRHIFKGLNRGLYCDDDPSGDKLKLIYTRTPSADYEWSGGAQGRSVKRNAPRGKVFSVIVSPNNKHGGDFPKIAGWVDRWSWILEDSALAEAPTNWVDRYDKRLWTRK